MLFQLLHYILHSRSSVIYIYIYAWFPAIISCSISALNRLHDIRITTNLKQSDEF
jgi:hypothetical protein